MEQQNYINWLEASIYTRSKSEVYQLLRIKGGYYLPPIEQANREYIYDIMTGSKKVLLILTTVKAFVVTPHEMWEILVINVFEMIFITQFIN